MTTPNESTTGTDVQGQPGVSEPSGTDNNATTQERAAENNGTMYDSYLERFPESLRPVATDVFKEWDAQTTKRFQDLHSEYEPWKPIAEEFDPQTVAQALAIATALERDPRQFYDALAQAYKFQQEQGVAEQQQELPPVEGEGLEYTHDPRIAQLEQAMQTMANIMLQERTQVQQAAENAELNTAMASLKEKHGEFDEDYVVTKIAQGFTPDKAIEAYKAAVEAALEQRNRLAAPTVMGAGGGLPSTQQAVKQLDSKQTQNLVAQMLEQNAAQRKQ